MQGLVIMIDRYSRQEMKKIWSDENKYNKWLVIEAEQDPDKANPYIYAQKGYSYLKSVIDDIGYII